MSTRGNFKAYEDVCPICGEHCTRDEVDIGVGTQYGPWHCQECGWSEDVPRVSGPEGDPDEIPF